jgi:hypothetical protein
VVQELETADPLGTLPEVALGDEQSERETVLGLEWLAVERVGQEHVIVIEDVEWQVGCVALLGVADDVGRGRADLRQLEDLLDRDAFPGRIELRPARHAMDVRMDLLAWEVFELLPGEREGRIDLAPHLEVPRRQIDPRHRAVVEHGELLRPVLAGRDPFGDGGIDCGVAEKAFEHESGVLTRWVGAMVAYRP